jgi:hypothetical protein
MLQMFIIYFRMKFHVPSSSGPYGIAVKLKVTWKILMALLFVKLN